jgi:hypothetical protein
MPKNQRARPNSICYNDRGDAVERFGLTKYQKHAHKSLSQVPCVDIMTPITEYTYGENFNHRENLSKKTDISSSMKSLNMNMKSARRKSFDALKKFFKIGKRNSNSVIFRRRTSITSVEFWEEEYTTIKRSCN